MRAKLELKNGFVSNYWIWNQIKYVSLSIRDLSTAWAGLYIDNAWYAYHVKYTVFDFNVFDNMNRYIGLDVHEYLVKSVWKSLESWSAHGKWKRMARLNLGNFSKIFMCFRESKIQIISIINPMKFISGSVQAPTRSRHIPFCQPDFNLCGGTASNVDSSARFFLDVIFTTVKEQIQQL